MYAGKAIFLSIVLVFCRHKFEEAQSSGVEFIFSKEDYLFELIRTLLFIITACIIGYIAWRFLRKWQNDKILFIIILNLLFISCSRTKRSNDNELLLNKNELTSTHGDVFLDSRW